MHWVLTIVDVSVRANGDYLRRVGCKWHFGVLKEALVSSSLPKFESVEIIIFVRKLTSEQPHVCPEGSSEWAGSSGMRPCQRQRREKYRACTLIKTFLCLPAQTAAKKSRLLGGIYIFQGIATFAFSFKRSFRLRLLEKLWRYWSQWAKAGAGRKDLSPAWRYGIWVKYNSS